METIGPVRTGAASRAGIVIMAAAALLAAASLLAATGVARGVEPEPPPAADPSPLSGPKVTASDGSSSAASATLVKRHFDGALEQLDRRPEVAALDLLGLTAQERAAADALLTKRAAKVSSLATEHATLLMSLQGSRERGGLPEDLRQKMREFREAAADLLNPPLAEQLGATLPESKRAEFRRLVSEYTSALSADETARQRGGMEPMDGERPAGRRPSRAGAGPMMMELNLLLRETGRGLVARVNERREALDQLLKTVEATDDQAEKIRRLARESASETTGYKQTEAQRAELTKKIMEVLTPEQRRKWMEAMRGR